MLCLQLLSLTRLSSGLPVQQSLSIIKKYNRDKTINKINGIIAIWILFSPEDMAFSSCLRALTRVTLPPARVHRPRKSPKKLTLLRMYLRLIKREHRREDKDRNLNFHLM